MFGEKKTVINGGFEVTNDSFNGNPMRGSWLMHKLTNFISRKINGKSDKREILQTTNDAAK